MRRIVHLSDIHFGTVDDAVAERAIEKITELDPDLVVVSGDLTQRARTQEFIDARAFLDRLPQPQIVVPGNHDVPLYNVYDRFFRGLDKYKKFITDDLTPIFVDDEIAVVGVNSARSMTIKGGRVNREQLEFIRSTLCGLSNDMLKVIVTHHPFDVPEGHNDDDLIGRAKLAFPVIAECGGDVFLSGHLHVSNIETTAKRYNIGDGRNAIVVQAGTATSGRIRGEAHSFNVLEFDRPTLRVMRLDCTERNKGFKTLEEKIYEQAEFGWERSR
ncbi:MAG: metallophosphoesterase [Acidobacteriota bacterium]